MSKATLSIEQAIECGIGLADKADDCALCQGPRSGACPTHAAPNVLRLLRECGYVEDDQ